MLPTKPDQRGINFVESEFIFCVLTHALQILKTFAYLYKLPGFFYLILKYQVIILPYEVNIAKLPLCTANASCVTVYPTSLSRLVPGRVC